MTTNNPKHVLGSTAIKPVERHGLEAIQYFFYDKDKGAIMGRTPKSWILITVFYLIYYICISAFWALMMFIFMLTINNDYPKLMGTESLIGTSPGVGIRPDQPVVSIDSSMFIFNKDRVGSTGEVPGWDLWAQSSRRFLSYYDNEGRVCTPDNYNEEGDACAFKIDQLGICGQGNYGFDAGQPCFYVKLNRIFGVTNSPYNESASFPDDMPSELKAHIESQADKNQVWIDCHGENVVDEESIGEIKYYPESRGFSSMYFPFRHQSSYESPVVAVQFMNPPLGQLLHVECRAWARNIQYDKSDRAGMVRFEVLMLNDEMAPKYGMSS